MLSGLLHNFSNIPLLFWTDESISYQLQHKKSKDESTFLVIWVGWTLYNWAIWDSSDPIGQNLYSVLVLFTLDERHPMLGVLKHRSAVWLSIKQQINKNQQEAQNFSTHIVWQQKANTCFKRIVFYFSFEDKPWLKLMVEVSFVS